MKLRGMKILSRKNENSLIDSTWESMICKNVAVSYSKKRGYMGCSSIFWLKARIQLLLNTCTAKINVFLASGWLTI